ncbi:MAG: hypothetical protein ACRDUY_03605 [Nitriliruptorales bacterium]
MGLGAIMPIASVVAAGSRPWVVDDRDSVAVDREEIPYSVPVDDRLLVGRTPS